MPNEGYVYFGVRGDFDVDAFTAMSGLQPTTAWNKGQRDPKRGLPMVALWDFGPDRTVTDSADDLVDVYALSESLIDLLEPSTDRIAAALAQFGATATLQVVLRISIDDRLSTPAIGFSPKVISFLHRVGASIDIDTYRSDVPCPPEHPPGP